LNSTARKVLALCGMAQPVVFAAFVVVEGLLEPRYSQVVDTISDYAVGPNGFLQDLSFWITGLLLVAFSIGLRNGLPAKEPGGKVAPLLLLVTGVCVFLVGFFVADLPGAPVTVHGDIHIALSFVAFVSLAAAIWVTWGAQRADPRWGVFASVSLGFGFAAAFALLVFFGAQLPGLQGLVERLVLGVLFLWVAVTAFGLYHLKSATTAS